MFESRKRVILDRGPSWPDYDKAEPFYDKVITCCFVKGLSGFRLIYWFIRSSRETEEIYMIIIGLYNNNFKRWLLGN